MRNGGVKPSRRPCEGFSQAFVDSHVSLTHVGTMYLSEDIVAVTPSGAASVWRPGVGDNPLKYGDLYPRAAQSRWRLEDCCSYPTPSSSS